MVSPKAPFSIHSFSCMLPVCIWSRLDSVSYFLWTSCFYGYICSVTAVCLLHIFTCCRLLFGPRHSDPGCDEPGQSGSFDAAAGGRGDDVKQVTDAAASGHPLHDCGYARARTQWQEMFLPPDYAEFNQTPPKSVNLSITVFRFCPASTTHRFLRFYRHQ